jgi:hypothetical protein
MSAAACPFPVPAGIRYEGPWGIFPGKDPIHLFTDLAETKSTVGIRQSQLSAKRLLREIAITRAKFRAAAADSAIRIPQSAIG